MKVCDATIPSDLQASIAYALKTRRPTATGPRLFDANPANLAQPARPAYYDLRWYANDDADRLADLGNHLGTRKFRAAVTAKIRTDILNDTWDENIWQTVAPTTTESLSWDMACTPTPNPSPRALITPCSLDSLCYIAGPPATSIFAGNASETPAGGDTCDPDHAAAHFITQKHVQHHLWFDLPTETTKAHPIPFWLSGYTYITSWAHIGPTLDNPHEPYGYPPFFSHIAISPQYYNDLPESNYANTPSLTGRFQIQAPKTWTHDPATSTPAWYKPPLPLWTTFAITRRARWSIPRAQPAAKLLLALAPPNPRGRYHYPWRSTYTNHEYQLVAHQARMIPF